MEFRLYKHQSWLRCFWGGAMGPFFPRRSHSIQTMIWKYTGVGGEITTPYGSACCHDTDPFLISLALGSNFSRYCDLSISLRKPLHKWLIRVYEQKSRLIYNTHTHQQKHYPSPTVLYLACRIFTLFISTVIISWMNHTRGQLEQSPFTDLQSQKIKCRLVHYAFQGLDKSENDIKILLSSPVIQTFTSVGGSRMLGPIELSSDKPRFTTSTNFEIPPASRTGEIRELPSISISLTLG